MAQCQTVWAVVEEDVDCSRASASSDEGLHEKVGLAAVGERAVVFGRETAKERQKREAAAFLGDEQ